MNTAMKSCFLILLSLATLKYALSSAQCNAIPNAYAHNDYWHKHPFYDALANGFTYFEADVFLKGNHLIVAHNNPFFKKHRTLEHLYLRPLATYLQQRSRQVPNRLDTLVLMIDIKSDAEKTFVALENVLSQYSYLLSSCENGQHIKRNLTIVITGHKALATFRSKRCRLFYVDEDLQQVNEDLPFSEMYATASCKFSKILNWNGKGKIPSIEKRRLCQLVAKAHSLGKKVRLWGLPEKEAVWRELLNCGVDLINTDKLIAFRKFVIASTGTLVLH
jgi:glycerophosphoryl diester phosphodiesterase